MTQTTNNFVWSRVVANLVRGFMYARSSLPFNALIRGGEVSVCVTVRA